MRNTLFFLCFILFSPLFAQNISFEEKAVFPDTLHPTSFMFNGVVDFNDDLLDDVLTMHKGYDFIPYYQKAVDASLSAGRPFNTGALQHWTFAVADLDGDGRRDVVVPGYNEPLSILYRDGAGFRVHNIRHHLYPQAMSILDVNGDGHLDIFVADDEGRNVVFLSDRAGGWIQRADYLGESEDARISAGNYGCTWTDFDLDGDLDLYVAKCYGKSKDPKDPRRTNRLFIQDSPGHYVQDSANTYGLAFGAQSWTSSFGDLDNDDDMDILVTHHDSLAYLLRNDKGHYVRVEQMAGVSISGFPLQSLFRDLDNNGYLDILVAGDPAYLYMNQGGWHFVKKAYPFGLYSPQSVGVGDLNTDGFLDVYATYKGLSSKRSQPDKVYYNSGNANHFIGFHLNQVGINTDAIGAKVLLYHKLDNQPVKQIREVVSGESYGIMNTLKVHFGLGATTLIDSMVVVWPDGVHEKFDRGLIADQYYYVQRGHCLTPRVEVVPDGEVDICRGDTFDITLDPSIFKDHIIWNDGTAGRTRRITRPGTYSVKGRDSNGCIHYAIPFEVFLERHRKPEIDFVKGGPSSCTGTAVLLAGRGVGGIKWWGTRQGDTLALTEDTLVWCVDHQRCGDVSSDTIDLHFIGDSTGPHVPDALVKKGESVTLHSDASGTYWYTSDTATTPVFIGAELHLESVDKDTVWWVSTADSATYDTAYCGLSIRRLHKRGYHVDRKNVKVYFKVDRDIVLSSVNTMTDSIGRRTIEIYNPDGARLLRRDIVLEKGINHLPLGVLLPASEGEYWITTDTKTNIEVLGTVSPRLIRNIRSFGYPYRCNPYLEIVRPSFSPDSYYYFYDWAVSPVPLYCESPRVPVHVKVDTVSHTQFIRQPDEWAVFPNPVGDNRVQLHLPVEFRSGLLDVKVHSVTGYSREYRLQANRSGKVVLPLTGFSPGVVGVVVTTTSGRQAFLKIIKL